MNGQNPEPTFPRSYVGETCVVQMPTQLTVSEAVKLKQSWKEWLASNALPARIILDFGRTIFIDSSGIGALFSCANLARRQQIAVVIWSVQPQLEMIFSITHIEQVIPIESRTQAIEPPPPSSKQDEHPYKPHPSVRSRLKRLIDITGALVGLGITSIVFIPIVIAIKVDSPGPIFFSQERCGWMGRRFRIWKFRSMVTNAEALKSQVQNQMEGALFKNENDPRVTQVGRFLRKTSLDELPQFWNVLKGDMSLVGTRPPTPDELEAYEVPNWQRLDVKPGITGEWQVHGRSRIRSFEEVIELDLRYQKQWSHWHDLQLILKTIWVLFQKDTGAF